jgi:thiol-disulfide isomerase/thioredoxin
MVDFRAEWCGPCRAIAAVLEELVEASEGRMTLMKINVDESPTLGGIPLSFKTSATVVLDTSWPRFFSPPECARKDEIVSFHVGLVAGEHVLCCASSTGLPSMNRPNPRPPVERTFLSP